MLHHGKLKCQFPDSIEWGKSNQFISDINKSGDLVDPDQKIVESFQRFIDDQPLNVATDHPIENEEFISQRAEVIRKEEHDLEQTITQLDDVIDSYAFPSNRPTRMIQDYHGSTFSLKGFVKFLCTDGQYKKIYENMAGHPRKDYMVSIILDVSMSMAGMAAYGSKNMFISLSGKVNFITSFSLVQNFRNLKLNISVRVFQDHVLTTPH